MKRIFRLALCLFSCTVIQASISKMNTTRVRSTSIETINSSRSSSPTNIELPAIVPVPTRSQIMQREVPIVLSTCEVLLQTGQTYVDEIKDCHTIGCLQCMHKCCTSPGTRPDLNPHRQVQGCRSHTDLACICIIGHSCSGAITYGLITLAC